MNFIIINQSSGCPELGPNLRWHNIGQSLVKFGHDVEIISSNNFHKFYSPPSVSFDLDGFHSNGIRYSFIKNIKYTPKSFKQVFSWFLFTFKLLLNFRRIFSRLPSVFIFSSPPIFSVLIIPLAKLFYPKHTYVFDVRDLWPLVIDDIRGASIPVLSSLMSFSESTALRYSDYVFSVKEGDFIYLNTKYKLSKKNFLHAPNSRFIPSMSFISDSDFLIKKEFKIYLGYVGSFGHYYDILKFKKIVHLLIDHNLISHFHFIFVGDGPLRHILEDELESLCPSAFNFFGNLPKLKADYVIQNLDICYLPLKELNTNKFGISCNKLYDYMSFSKPILGHYSPSEYDPIILSGCGVCCSLGDEINLLPFFKNAISHPYFLINLGEKGFSYFIKHHTPDVVSLKILSFLGSRL